MPLLSQTTAYTDNTIEGVKNSINRNLSTISGKFAAKRLEDYEIIPGYQIKGNYRGQILKLFFTDGSTMELTDQDLDACFTA